MRTKAFDIPKLWHAGVTYLKSKLMKGVVFSMPPDLYNEALNGREAFTVINYDVGEPWSASCNAVLTSPVGFYISTTDNTVFFEVTNARPEARHNVIFHHAQTRRDSVHVAKRQVMTVSQTAPGHP